MITMMLVVSSMLYAKQEPSAQKPSISFGPIQPVTDMDQRVKPREFTVTVEPVGEGEPQHFKVRGPYKLLSLDEQPRGEIVDDRLVVTTSRLIAVFDLETGEQLVDKVAAPEVVVTEDGRRVAFVTLQLKFLPIEATSSVIQVIDVPTLQIEPVFPERSIIERSPTGRLLAWVDEPADRHLAGDLFFSPDGSRLGFFCSHGGSTMPDVQRQLYVVMVDLSRGVDESRFIHRPFDWEAYLRPNVDLGDRQPYFVVESLEWTDNNTVVIRVPDDLWWLKDHIVIELPPPNEWPTETHSAEEEDHEP